MTDNDESSLLSLSKQQEEEICSKEIKYELCLICCSKVEINTVQNDNVEVLHNSLSVVFILRNLLKVPSSQLEVNLKEFGNPNNWIRLCDQCTKITRQAEKLYCQITENSRKLKSIQKLIVSKIRTLAVDTQDKVNAKHSDRIEVRKKIYNFVNKYGYIEQSINKDNPFSEGDKLAKYLVKSKTGSSPFPTKFDSQLHNEVEDDNTNVSFNDWDDADDMGDHGQEVEPVEVKIDTKTIIEPTRPTNRTSSRKLKLSSGSKRPYQKMININGKWKCRHCDKLFLSNSSCNVHERKFHYSNPSDKHICDICGKALRDPNSLLVHRRNVHKIRLDGTQTIRKPKNPEPPRKKYPATCNICGKYFQDRSYLKNHLKFVHETQMEHKCDICGITAFARKFDLKRHQLTIHKDNPKVQDLMEEGIKIWRCKVKGCRAQFIKKRNLDKHCDQYHKDDSASGRFACSFCGRFFWEMHNLRNHEMVHRNVNEGKNPYCCEECGLGFPSPAYLNNHKQNVHKKARK